VGSAQSRLLPQGRRFAELAGQSGEIDVERIPDMSEFRCLKLGLIGENRFLLR